MVERFGARQAEIDTGNAEKLLEGSGITCPPVDAALMKSYLFHFYECGYIAKPAGGVAGALKGFLGTFRGKK